MSTVAENCWVMQTKRDQLITHNVKKCDIILFRKQIKGNDSQWLETTFKYLVRYPLGEIIVCNARSLTACMHDIFMIQLTFEIWHFHSISSGEDLLFFLRTKTLLAVRQKFLSLHHDQKCLLLLLALTMFVPSNTARAILR